MIQSPTGSKVSDSSIYVADMINYAISNKKQIQFQYFEYNEKKDKILKHNGYIYEVSPTFYAWIFQFEGDIIIQSPQNAIDDFIKTAEIIIEVHKRKGTI
ncbi:hypothetical protein SAMN02910325_01881 [Ruminococcus flavefaciens]|uniref:WYL domain-containing protein n=1 Tax=Ruminococcus flavefaciens TaxID=1265 RepID=A0A315XXH0_RUMFL|nr:hypothetical protein IE37_01881 [Ruminococcus flavefaciens]SSA49681.1 hypothetical protein SAMN02910325_01881 [Ruminococcus flavefaciens]